MKRIFRAWTWCVLGFGLWLGSATQVEAQGACGVGCEWCGNFRWEAVIYWHDAPLSMTCNWFSGTCDRCMLSVDASIVEADEIVEIAKASSPNELGLLVAAYGERLFLNAERRLLIVKGTPCAPEAVGAMVVLNQAQVAALAELPTGDLRALLSAERATYPGFAARPDAGSARPTPLGSS